MLPCPPTSCVRFVVHSHVLPTAKRLPRVGDVWMSNAETSIDGVANSLRLPEPITTVWAASRADGSFDRSPKAGAELAVPACVLHTRAL
jgi:hypothetical protein